MRLHVNPSVYSDNWELPPYRVCVWMLCSRWTMSLWAWMSSSSHHANTLQGFPAGLPDTPASYGKIVLPGRQPGGACGGWGGYLWMLDPGSSQSDLPKTTITHPWCRFMDPKKCDTIEEGTLWIAELRKSLLLLTHITIAFLNPVHCWKMKQIYPMVSLQSLSPWKFL